MGQRKKFAITTTAVALSASLLVGGCSSGKDASSSASPGASAGTEKPIEIVIANNYNAPETDDNFVQKKLEEKFNIKIKNVKYERSSWKEKFSVSLASGETPDLFPVDVTETDMVQWADQGIIASLSVDEIKKYMPNYVKALESVDNTAWDIGLYKGKNWGVPRVYPGGLNGFLPAYNEQWLKKIGYTSTPKTLAEVEDVLNKFVNNDPDGNGKKDTYGLGGRGKLTNQLFPSIFAAHNVAPYQFRLAAGGKAEYGGISEDARATLKLLAKWYKAGYIDPEFITSDNNENNVKVANQKIGMLDNVQPGNTYLESGYIGKPANEKGLSYIPGSIVSTDGQLHAVAYGARQAPILIGANAAKDEAKRIKILQLLEYVSTNDEGWLLTQYGEEGVNYTRDASTGLVVASTDPNMAGTKAGASGFYNMLGGVDSSKSKYNTKPIYAELSKKYYTEAGIKLITDLIGPTVLTSKPKYWTNLQTLQDSYFIKAIAGEVNTDSDFDTYKNNWLKSGGQEVTDEVTKVYQERTKK
ncbi:extracellular solute-binding protein [Paenibacillus oryzisoli]|uniref:extracellular solute-binding protein n=1 Tax=Paenibacillus oryzisoli TaxID=1850517 RepID=UPI003D2C09A8